MIGEYLPIDKVLTGVRAAACGSVRDGGDAAAHAIMTTDTVAKEAVVVGSQRLDGRRHGQRRRDARARALATMLVVLTTDAVADAGTLDTALRAATAKHVRPARLRRLHVDQRHRPVARVRRVGDRGRPPTTRPPRSKAVCARLPSNWSTIAKAPARSSRSTSSARVDETEALDVARAVARSNLLKCAIHGEDPNWGRILSALGTTDARPSTTTVSTSRSTASGSAARRRIGDDRSGVDMSARRVASRRPARRRSPSATLLTTDLTAEYVHENSAYST